MGKYPLLDALRAARAQREEPIRAPLEAELQRARAMIRELRDEKRQLEDLLRLPIAKHLIEGLSCTMARDLPSHIYRAIDEAMRREPEKQVVMVPFSVDDLRRMVPDELEQRVARYYSRWIEERSEIESRSIPEGHALRVRISIPRFSFEQAVARSLRVGGPREFAKHQ